MKVLVLLTSASRRGAELEGQRFAEGLAQAGIQVELVALSAGRTPAVLPIEVLGSRPLAVKTLMKLRRRASNFDLVVAYGSSTLPACALSLVWAVPFVYRSIGDPAAWLRGGWHRRRTALLINRAAHVVVLWGEAAEAVCALYGVPRRKVTVIPNTGPFAGFVPATSDQRAAARRSLSLPLDEPVILAAGALTDEKRTWAVIDAVAALGEARLLVVGDGPQRLLLQERGQDALGDNIQFAGVMQQMSLAYHAADVVVLASRTEGMPAVVIEATLSGVPVVAPAVGAIPWLFGAGARGELTNASPSPAELARALQRVVARTALGAGELQEQDPSFKAQFDWSRLWPKWQEVLFSVKTGVRR